MDFPILSFITFAPILGIIIILLSPQQTESNKNFIRMISLITSLVVFAVSIGLYCMFKQTGDFQFVESFDWIPSIGVKYLMGIDGISLWMVILTTFLTPITILSTWSSITKKVKEFQIAMLFLEIGMIGVFSALDLFLFYIFWEVMLIPMYLMIGIWGGERRIYAAVKFFLYTMVASLLMLVAIIALVYINYRSSGVMTFSITDLYNAPLSMRTQILFFAIFASAFAVKVPMFPVHTWLPDAHVEAPTPASVILAGVLLKMGVYGFLRFAMPLFPSGSAYFSPLILTLSVIAIIYGSLVAMVQADIKKLVAYSSVAHMGFITLGIYALNHYGVEGAILQMINHGVSTGALFLLVGVVYERRHTRLISEYGGIAAKMPVYSTIFFIVTLSSIGLPITNGFVGEFLILVGTFNAHWGYAVFAASGVILSAIYMLWMYQRVFYGKVTNPANENLHDLTRREFAVFLPLLAFIFIIGIFPNIFISKMDASVDKFFARTGRIEKTVLPLGPTMPTTAQPSLPVQVK